VSLSRETLRDRELPNLGVQPSSDREALRERCPLKLLRARRRGELCDHLLRRDLPLRGASSLSLEEEPLNECVPVDDVVLQSPLGEGDPVDDVSWSLESVAVEYAVCSSLEVKCDREER
jgi:hypothetical protein